VTSNHLVRFRSTSPRKNLPPNISRKRAEANFLCSFERAFVAGHCQTKQITWRDFALQGYGIPDLITFGWSTQQNQATVLSLEALRQKLQRQQFTAFELKLRDWRKGIVQAYRYRAAYPFDSPKKVVVGEVLNRIDGVSHWKIITDPRFSFANSALLFAFNSRLPARFANNFRIDSFAAGVALYLNRGQWPFTALNSWTGSLSTRFNSWTELH
jgi:hypothetical protein